jgi:hypothetical protein
MTPLWNAQRYQQHSCDFHNGINQIKSNQVRLFDSKNKTYSIYYDYYSRNAHIIMLDFIL